MAGTLRFKNLILMKSCQKINESKLRERKVEWDWQEMEGLIIKS